MKNKPYPLYELPLIGDLREMVAMRQAQTPDATAFTYNVGEMTVSRTCYDFAQDIAALGTYLHTHGLAEAHIAILGENSYEWLVAFLAIVNGGGVAVPLDREMNNENVLEMLHRSDCAAVIVSKRCAHLVADAGVTVLEMAEYSAYLAQGRRSLAEGERRFLDYPLDPMRMAAIFFTSGTTGSGKGVMLSHRNMASDINFACKNFVLDGDTLAVLPFHHTFGLITAIFKVFHYRHATHINRGLRYLREEMTTIRPQTVFWVPLFVESYYKNIFLEARKKGIDKTLRRTMFLSDIFLKLGLDLRRKLFEAVHEVFGGRLEYIICGGAPLDPRFVRVYQSLGITILNGYGITECSPVVSVNRNHYWRTDSVGQILQGCTVKIAEDGEVLVKGDNVMLGYYKDEAATQQVLQNGWYATGDLGRVDKHNFLYLTGRKKNLVILSNGENISPEEIEARIQKDKAVEEVVVYGKDGLLCAQIFPAQEYMYDRAHFERLIAILNLEQPKYKRIRKIELRETEFEKSSTKKILRYKITGE